MDNTIFMTIEGGVIQNINITNDLDNIKAIVIDFDTDGIEDYKLDLIDSQPAVIYEYKLNTIDDGDVEKFEGLMEKS